MRDEEFKSNGRGPDLAAGCGVVDRVRAAKEACRFRVLPIKPLSDFGDRSGLLGREEIDVCFSWRIMLSRG